MTVDDTAVELSQEISLEQSASSSGLHSHSLTFQIINAESKRAGIYKDMINVSVMPLF